MKITESITAHLNMNEIREMIELHTSREGYEVVKITAEYEKEYSHDPRDPGDVIGHKFIGFKLDLKRKSQPIKRSDVEPATRDWFDTDY